MLGYRHHQQTGRKISPNIHSTKGRGQTPPALWILSDCLWLRCSAEMQAYSEDAEMTFEVYARGWLERQTKYAPYDRLLPTFARNRVPGVGGWAPISIILRSTPPQPPARCAVFHLRSLPARIVPVRHPAGPLPDETIPQTRPWSSVRF